MNTLLSLSIPNAGGGQQQISVPSYIPTGGFEPGGMAHRVVSLGVEVIFIGAILLTLFSLIYAGYQFMTSEGDKASIDAAKQRIIFTLVGLVVVFLAIFIINVIGSFFGIDLIKQPPGVWPSCDPLRNPNC